MSNTFDAFLETTEIQDNTINVYGIWSCEKDYEDNKDPDYYDVYLSEGMTSICLNEGNPLYEKPTVDDCHKLLYDYLNN